MRRHAHDFGDNRPALVAGLSALVTPNTFVKYCIRGELEALEESRGRDVFDLRCKFFLQGGRRGHGLLALLADFSDQALSHDRVERCGDEERLDVHVREARDHTHNILRVNG